MYWMRDRRTDRQTDRQRPFSRLAFIRMKDVLVPYSRPSVLRLAGLMKSEGISLSPDGLAVSMNFTSYKDSVQSGIPTLSLIPNLYEDKR